MGKDISLLPFQTEQLASQRASHKCDFSLSGRGNGIKVDSCNVQMAPDQTQGKAVL